MLDIQIKILRNLILQGFVIEEGHLMKQDFFKGKTELVRLNQLLEKGNIVDTYHVMKGQDICKDNQGICLGILLMKSECWVYITGAPRHKRIELSHLDKTLQSRIVQCQIYQQNK